MQVNYTDAESFRSAGYEPFVVDGEEYGEVREAGMFSFTRIYQAGHEGTYLVHCPQRSSPSNTSAVPYYQPKASLEIFRRILGNLIIADGSEAISEDYGTEGDAEATHTESFVPLPTASASASASGGAM